MVNAAWSCVILLPHTDDPLWHSSESKTVDTETFVSGPAVEGFDEPIPPGARNPTSRLSGELSTPSGSTRILFNSYSDDPGHDLKSEFVPSFAEKD